jgi:hypothetical protein
VNRSTSPLDSSMSDKPQYWYAAKRYGWGWGPPTSWHGWVVLALLIAALLGPAPFFLRPDRIWMYLVYVGGLTVLQFLICYLKGPPPRWRWGDSDD